MDAGAPAAHYFSLYERKKSNQKKVAQFKPPAGSLSAVNSSGAIKNSFSFATALCELKQFYPEGPG